MALDRPTNKWSPGCKCCKDSGPPPACGQVCVTVRGCSANVGAGYTVQLKSGSTVVSSCTTNSSGQCCLPVYAAGTYNVVVTPPAGKKFSPATVSTGAVGCTTTNITVNLSVLDGYQCQGAICCLNGPVPTALTLSVPTGTLTLTYDPGTTYSWSGCHTPTLPDACATTLIPCTGPLGPYNAYDDHASPGPVPIHYTLTCDGAYWTLANSYGLVFGTTGCDQPTFTGVFYSTGTCSANVQCGAEFPIPPYHGGGATLLTGTCVDGVITLSGAFDAAGGSANGRPATNPDAGTAVVTG